MHTSPAAKTVGIVVLYRESTLIESDANGACTQVAPSCSPSPERWLNGASTETVSVEAAAVGESYRRQLTVEPDQFSDTTFIYTHAGRV